MRHADLDELVEKQPELFDLHVMMFADRSEMTAQALQRTFAIDRALAERMLEETPVLVKRAADPELAAALLDTLQRLGAQVVLLPSATQPEPPPQALETAGHASSANLWGGLDFDSVRPRKAEPAQTQTLSRLHGEHAEAADGSAAARSAARSLVMASEAQMLGDADSGEGDAHGDEGDEGELAFNLDDAAPAEDEQDEAPRTTEHRAAPAVNPRGVARAIAISVPPPVPRAGAASMPPGVQPGRRSPPSTAVSVPPPVPTRASAAMPRPHTSTGTKQKPVAPTLRGASAPSVTTPHEPDSHALFSPELRARDSAADGTRRRVTRDALDAPHAGAEPAAYVEPAANEPVPAPIPDKVEPGPTPPRPAALAEPRAASAPSRAGALLSLVLGAAGIYLGIRMDNSVLYGNATHVSVALHGLALYGIGAGIAGLWR